jgi:hypothetical protein
MKGKRNMEEQFFWRKTKTKQFRWISFDSKMFQHKNLLVSQYLQIKKLFSKLCFNLFQILQYQAPLLHFSLKLQQE